jgi:hypothetical protein
MSNLTMLTGGMLMPWNRDDYDDFGWRKDANVPPITHEELKRLRKMPWHDNALYFAELITGEEDMNVLAFLDGKPGAGKSTTGLNLLWGSAIWTADLLWKDPAKWRKILPYQETIKIIDNEDCFFSLFKDQRKYIHKFGDDAFGALDRLKFQGEQAREQGLITATDRPFRNVTFISAQWMGMVLKIIRDLAGYRIDCKRDMYARKIGYNKYKFHILDYNQYDKSNPIMNRYVHTNKSDVEDHVSGMPCEEIWDWYKEERFNAALKLKQSKTDDTPDEQPSMKMVNEKGIAPKIIKYIKTSNDLPPLNKKDYKMYVLNLANTYNCSEETVKRAIGRWGASK